MPPLSLLPVEHLMPAMEDRAWEVQMLLADRGQHRAPSIPDLLIAATADKGLFPDEGVAHVARRAGASVAG